LLIAILFSEYYKFADFEATDLSFHNFKSTDILKGKQANNSENRNEMQKVNYFQIQITLTHRGLEEAQ
jgi:hypothetical protein